MATSNDWWAYSRRYCFYRFVERIYIVSEFSGFLLLYRSLSSSSSSSLYYFLGLLYTKSIQLFHSLWTYRTNIIDVFVLWVFFSLELVVYGLSKRNHWHWTDYCIFVHIPRGLCTFLHAKKKPCGIYKGAWCTESFLHDLCTMPAAELTYT